MDNQTKLHEERKLIDARIQAVDALKKDPAFAAAGREIALAYTHLQEAKMWLGQSLGMLGSELPAQFADKAEAQPAAPAEPGQVGSDAPAAPETPAEQQPQA